MSKESYDPSKYSSKGMPRHEMPILIDFDNTIAKGCWPQDGIGEELEGAREAIKKLREIHPAGTVIFTSRPSHEERVIWRWLFDHDIKVDGLQAGKKSGYLYIGDEAIGFRGNWKKTLKETEEFMKKIT